MAVPSLWIESSFTRHECMKFIPSLRDNAKCCCGQLWQYHSDGSPATMRCSHEAEWRTSRHTQQLATDAYGTIEFYGAGPTTKAKFVRLSYETPLHLLQELLSCEWGLKLPKLIISVHGRNSFVGETNSRSVKLKKIIRRGLLKAAKTTGAWMFTSGTNSGSARIVGEAMSSDSKHNTSSVVTIGICPWGTVDKRMDFIGRNKEVMYHPRSNSSSRYASLNSQHKYFLLVDDGTAGKHGSEKELRRRLEQYISQQHIDDRGDGLDIPLVSVIIEGGAQSIREVYYYVTATPPVPVIVCEGTGGAADLLASIQIPESRECFMLESMESGIELVKGIFSVGDESAKHLYFNLKECIKRKNMITVFRISDDVELDQCILSALLQDRKFKPSQQLSLALTWNCEDVARKVIFSDSSEWSDASLDNAMMEALLKSRLEFVKLLLEHGVSMKKFLSPKRLEELYNAPGPPNTLHYIIKDVRKLDPKGEYYTLIDIGLAVNKLMGGAFRSGYTRKRFVQNYKLKKTNWYHPMTTPTQKGSSDKDSALVFDYPFGELLVWAVLTKRHNLALLMWEQGEEPLAKALVAAKLYKSLADEAKDDDLAQEIYDELCSYAVQFDTLAYEFLDYCHLKSRDLAHQVLTHELQNWSKQTCLSLAASVNHKSLMAHPGCQILLADLWLGGLRTRKNTTFKILMCLLCPVFIPKMSFLSGEELRTMPQRVEEHMDLEQESSDSDSSVSDSEDYEQPEDNRIQSCEIKIEAEPQNNLLPPSGRVSRTSSFRASSIRLPQEESYEENSPYKTSFFVASKPLPLRMKFYEFYHAPVTKFWAHTLAFLVFLFVHTYVCLVKLPRYPQWTEWYLFCYVSTYLMEKGREILETEAVNIRKKVVVWVNLWNILDVIFSVIFLMAFYLRFYVGHPQNAARVMLCVGISYWYIKTLEFLSVSKYFGPFETMMWKMVKNMIYFVVLLVVVLMSFGVSRQGILFPNEVWSWRLLRHIFYQPYFMLYGEVFAGDIDPPCGGEGEVPCHTGRWVTPISMAIFLLVANIVLLNLLIAVFNSIYANVQTVAQQVWKFQRYKLVITFEEKPVFPPPFIIMSLLYRAFKFFRSKMAKRRYTHDHGLKIFLSGEALDQLHETEMECLEGYVFDREHKKKQSQKEFHCQGHEKCHERFEEILTRLLNANQRPDPAVLLPTSVSPVLRDSTIGESLMRSPCDSHLPTPTSGTPKAVSIPNLDELYSEVSPDKKLSSQSCC